MENENDLSKFADLVDESEDVPFLKKIIRGAISFIATVVLCTVFILISTFANLGGSTFIVVSFAFPAAIMGALYQAGKFNIRLLPVAFGIIFSVPIILVAIELTESL